MQAKKSKIEISTYGLYAKAEVNLESPTSSYQHSREEIPRDKTEFGC